MTNKRSHNGELLINRNEGRILDPCADHAEKQVKAVECQRRVDVWRRVSRVIAQGNEESHDCQHTSFKPVRPTDQTRRIYRSLNDIEDLVAERANRPEGREYNHAE